MRPSKIFIFGQGQLGTYYKMYFEEKTVLVISEKVEIRDEVAVRQALMESRPDLVINSAAKTNIDWCEQNKIEAFHINTLGADNIGKVCQDLGIYLLHISSGCVQESVDALDAKTEEDAPNPLCFYSWTKVWAENLLADRGTRHGLKCLILRPRQLLSAVVSPRNAVTKLLTYKKFIDTPNSCTVVEDLMRVSEELLSRDATGVYNVVNPGVTSPYEIALMLKEIVKPDLEFVKISKSELNAMTLAKRVDAVLSIKKLNDLGIDLPEIHVRLREILIDFREGLSNPETNDILERTKEETAKKLSLKHTSS